MLQELNKAQRELADFRNLSTSQDDRFKEIEDQLHAAEDRERGSEKTIQRLEDQISEMVSASKASRTGLERERDSVQLLLNQADEQRKDDLANIGRLTSSSVEANKGLETLQKSNQYLEEVIAGLKVDVKRLEKSRRSNREETANLNQQATVDYDRITQLEEEIKSLKSNPDQANLNLKVDGENAREVEQLKKKIRELQSQSAHHDLDLHRLNSANSKLHEINQQFRIAL